MCTRKEIWRLGQQAENKFCKNIIDVTALSYVRVFRE